MNKVRRKELEALLHDLQNLQEAIEIIKMEEESAYENMPESVQTSERGEKMEENIDSLDSAYDDIQSAIDNIQEVFER